MIRIFMTGYSESKGGVESYIDNLMASLDKNKMYFKGLALLDDMSRKT